MHSYHIRGGVADCDSTAQRCPAIINVWSKRDAITGAANVILDGLCAVEPSDAYPINNMVICEIKRSTAIPKLQLGFRLTTVGAMMYFENVVVGHTTTPQ